MKLILLRLGLWVAFAAVALGAVESKRRPITPRDVWEMKRLSSPAISPEGQRVVFSVQEWSIEKNESASSLWVVEIAGGAPRRLTTVPGSDGSPAWSPDGTRIAFVSKRAGDEVPSLYVIPADGGEAEKVLDARQLNIYENELAELCNLKAAKSLASAYRWHAEAAQRAEAFLRTLNLWRDDA
jgi:tricorn protease-like protein